MDNIAKVFIFDEFDPLHPGHATCIVESRLHGDTHYAASAINLNGGGGGAGAVQNQVRDVWISMNQVDSIVPAVHLVAA